ncbi:uncharacterized protein LOC133534638 [Cydia pomonella]|uniref:uncharacterized protein LOC133534638 n=1 Tax=Cydia pomonella TaxID=82600 RepID=UPI002ADE5E55|nr:uncharacterized protein LOC133534638 [Cydia pomonella]
MDEDLILREIVKSLAFEIEAVNQDNVLTWTTTNGTPLNVKVRVRNKDEPRLIQKGVIPVPRIGITAPEKLRLISSDQTILSFNVYLDGESEKEPKRHNGLKLFNIGSCLGTYSDDEGPYLPSSSEQNAVESGRCSKSASGIFKKKLSMSPVLSSTNTVTHTQKSFFGKCKPGGCLDPPFDEDRYAYSLSKADCQENLPLECNKTKKLDDNKDTCEPGGCLDPPFSEDKYPYTVSKTHQPVKLELFSQSAKDEKQTLSNKSSEEHHKTLDDKKTIKEEGDLKKLMDNYAKIPREDSLEAKYSNSIITYPTDVSSNETLCDQIPNKKISIKSNDDEAQRQSYDNPASYFVPPKDVMRYKEEERRYSRRISSDTIDKICKSTPHYPSTVEKTKYMEHDYIPQYVTPSKDTQKEDIKPNNTDDATLKKYYNNQSDIVEIEQEKTSFVDIPSYVATNSKKVGSYQNSHDEERASKYLSSTESNPNKNENDYLVSQQESVSPIDNQKLYFDKTKNPEENVKTKQDKPIVERAEIGSRDQLKDKLLQSEVSYISVTQAADSLDAKKDALYINLTTLETENPKFPNTYGPLKDDIKLNFGSNNNDDISKSSLVAEATIPVLATATLPLSKKQSLQFNDKLNIGLDSLVTEKDEASMSKKCSEDLLKKSTEQKLENHENEPKNSSPQSISSSENNEFDVSSEHSMDFKQELSNNVETRNTENALGHKEKQELLVESMDLTSTNNVIMGKNISKDDYIKSDPESEKKRPSAILQKKAFSANRDLDMEYDDINKTTALKRNTFTVIASGTSIEKCEDIEEIPGNITDVYFKTTDVPKLSSPDLTKNSTVIADTKNKKLEGEISSTPRISQPGKIKDLHLNVSNDTKSTTIDSRTKKLESTFYADVDGSLSHTHSLNLTINQTELNTTSNENEINTDPLHNRLPANVRHVDTNIGETVQSPLNIETLLTKYKENENTNANYKETELLHKPENIQDIYLISENTKSLDIGTKGLEPPSESVEDSLQKTIPDNIQYLDATVSVSDKSAVNQETANVYLAKRKSENILYTDSNISVTKNNTDDLRSKMMTNRKFVAESSTEILPENARDLYPEINLDDNSASFTKNHDQPEPIKTLDIKLNNGNKLINDDIDTYQKHSHTENGKYFSVDSASNRIEVVNLYDNSNADKTPEVVPEFIQDLNDKKEQKDFDYNKREKAKHDDSITDFVPKITSESAEIVQARTSDDEAHTNFGQIDNKNDLLNTHSNKYPKQIKLAQNVPELPNFKNELLETQDVEYNDYGLVDKTEIVTRSNLPSGGYSGLLSEVLSNISEDREGEERNNVRSKSFTETIGRQEDFVNLDTEAYRDYKSFDNEFTSISKESESNSIMSEIDVGSNYTHKAKVGSYIIPINNLIKSSVSTLKDIDYNVHKETSPETLKSIQTISLSNSIDKDYALLRITRDVSQLNTTDMIDQLSEYQSSQIPASIHDLIGLNKNNIRAKSISPYGKTTLYQKSNTTKPKESNIDATESSFSKNGTSPLYVDMSFYSYIDDNKQRVVQTQSPRIDKQNPSNGTVTIVKTLIRHGNEIRIPVDNENDISLNILDKDVRLEKRNSIIGLPIYQTHREKYVVDRAKKHKDCLNKNLALIYESELIPLHAVIKDLTQELNTLASNQEILQMKMRNTKRTKSSRLIPVVKRCGCRRI